MLGLILNFVISRLFIFLWFQDLLSFLIYSTAFCFSIPKWRTLPKEKGAKSINLLYPHLLRDGKSLNIIKFRSRKLIEVDRKIGNLLLLIHFQPPLYQRLIMIDFDSSDFHFLFLFCFFIPGSMTSMCFWDLRTSKSLLNLNYCQVFFRHQSTL